MLQLQVTCADAVSSPSAPGIHESSSMSSSSSRATSRMEIPVRTEMLIFVCPRYRMDIADTEERESSVLRVHQRDWGKNRGNFTIFMDRHP